MTRLTIVRHTRAGNKRAWTLADDLRPLDPTGEQQATELARLLTSWPVSRVVSSPTERCVQTVRPLADAVGLPIELWSELAPDGDVSSLIGCFDDPSFDDAVLCTHGELMRPLLRSLDLAKLHRRDRPIDRRRLLTKGSAWRLRISPKGRVVELEHIIPRG